jgi:hypothetical protein
MKIKRKEICFGIILAVLVVFSAIYVNYVNTRSEETYMATLQSRTSSFSQETQQQSKIITETIVGELKRGTFENVVNSLETLTEEKDGYVDTLSMTYQDQVWTGLLICKLPPTDVTSFTFSARAIIEANGTVTYINIRIEERVETQQGQDTYSTINLNLEETKPENGTDIAAMLAPVLSVLATSFSWIAQGLVIGVPLCFASLGIVIFVNRGIIPVWKNTLKKTKQACKA